MAETYDIFERIEERFNIVVAIGEGRPGDLRFHLDDGAWLGMRFHGVAARFTEQTHDLGADLLCGRSGC